MCYLSINSIINVIYSIAWNIYLFKHGKKYKNNCIIIIISC